jgi:hypothetical protein
MRVIISTKTCITTGEKIMDNVFDEADNLISLLTDNMDMLELMECNPPIF